MISNKENLMRTIFIAMVFFTLILPCTAQDTDKVVIELDSVALKMFKNVNDRDYEGIMDMTHPKVFDLVPKDMMITVYKSMFEGNEEFTIDIPKIVPEYKISEVFKDEDNNTDYAFVSYDMPMSMTFHKEEGFDDDGKELMINAMKMQGLEGKFVSDNTIEILKPNAIAIMLKDEIHKEQMGNDKL